MNLSSVQSQQNSGPSPARRRRSRGTGQRARTGCLTCKARRVKCDETKPACRRCTDFNRVCEGYPHTQDLGLRAQAKSRSRNQSPSPLSSSNSQRRFTTADAGSRRGSSSSDYSIQELKQYTMPSMPGYFAPCFWSQLVERIAHVEPAAQCALNALSGFHSVIVERQGTGPAGFSIPGHDESSTQQIALQQYNGAIEQLKYIMASRGTRETEIILVCCYLFICIESLLGNMDSAIRHAEAGLKVYRDWRITVNPALGQYEAIPSSSNPRYCIWRLSSELESMLGDLTNELSVEVDSHPIEDDEAWNFGPHIKEFASLEHVHCAMVSIRRKLRRLLRITAGFPAQDMSLAPDHILHQFQELEELGKAFDGPYHRYMAAIPPAQVDRKLLVIQMRYILQTTFQMGMRQQHSDHELATRYQDLLHTAEMIIRPIPYLQESPTSIAEAATSSQTAHIPSFPQDTNVWGYLQVPFASSGLAQNWKAPHLYEPLRVPNFNLAIQVVPCLFHTAKVAPTIGLRQKAIALLRASNSVEGIWNSFTAARLAEEILRADLSGTPASLSPPIDYSWSQHLGTLYQEDLCHFEDPLTILPPSVSSI